MTVWITGASGYIGTRLRAALARARRDHAGLDIASPPEGTSGRHFVVGPVGTDGLTKLLAATGRPDVVFHLAGGSAVGPSFKDPEADFRNSVASASVILDFVRRTAPSAVTVLASSAAVYGNDHSDALGENAVPAPFSPYGTHKLMMEMLGASYAEHFGLDIRVVRPFSVYGAGLRKQLFWDLCVGLKAERAATLGGSGREQRDFVHGDDVAAALMLIAEVPKDEKGRIVNIASGVGVTIQRVAGIIADSWKRETGLPDAPVISFSGVSRPGDPACLVGDNGRLAALGFRESTSLEDGLSDYVRWFLRAAP